MLWRCSIEKGSSVWCWSPFQRVSLLLTRLIMLLLHTWWMLIQCWRQQMVVVDRKLADASSCLLVLLQKEWIISQLFWWHCIKSLFLPMCMVNMTMCNDGDEEWLMVVWKRAYLLDDVSYSNISTTCCTISAAQACPYMQILQLIPLVNTICDRSSKWCCLVFQRVIMSTACVWLKNRVDPLLPSTAYEYSLSSQSCWWWYHVYLGEIRLALLDDVGSCWSVLRELVVVVMMCDIVMPVAYIRVSCWLLTWNKAAWQGSKTSTHS